MAPCVLSIPTSHQSAVESPITICRSGATSIRGGSRLKTDKLSRSLIIVVALTLLVPLGAASHWTLYYAGIDESAGRTLEDDHAIVDAGGDPFDGRENRVVYPGSRPGDGGLFLDSRVMTGAPGISLFLADYAGEFTGRRDLMMPGPFDVAAWYGEWNDFNDDGAIQDIADAACPSNCVADEFRWRGAVTGHADVMRFASLKGVNYPNLEMRDHTQQGDGWRLASVSGQVEMNAQAFIATTHTVTFVGAPALIGSRIGYDLDDARALVDVDRYAAASPDIEALYRATGQPVCSAPGVSSVCPALELYDFVWDQVFGGVATAFALAGTTIEESNARDLIPSVPDEPYEVVRTTSPWFKEPNQVDDDYAGRALFGGVGDRLGSFNQFPGYESEHHLYFDNLARFTPCAGAGVSLPAGMISPDVRQCRVESPWDAVDVDPSSREREHSTGAILSFYGIHMLWRDRNGDAHTGRVCDVESERFDAERNTCSNAARWPNQMSGVFEDETISVCEDVIASTRVRGFGITVSPVEGAWPAAVLWRDYAETLQIPPDPTTFTPLSGGDPVTLRWRFECAHGSSSYGVMITRDAIMFPLGGTSVPLRVESTVTLEGYRDLARGIDFGFEYVQDVDILPVSL